MNSLDSITNGLSNDTNLVNPNNGWDQDAIVPIMSGLIGIILVGILFIYFYMRLKHALSSVDSNKEILLKEFQYHQFIGDLKDNPYSLKEKNNETNDLNNTNIGISSTKSKPLTESTKDPEQNVENTNVLILPCHRAFIYTGLHRFV